MTATRPLCLVISLPDAGERRAGLVAALEAQGIAAAIVPGVDARRGLPAEAERLVDREAAERRLGRAMMDGEIGAALSHVAALRRFLDSGTERALVFEDDAIVGPGLSDFLDAGGAEVAPLVMLHHSRARVRSGETGVQVGGVAALRLANTPFMACAYILDRAVAEAIVAAQSPVRGLADWPVDLAALGARAVVPMLVGHPPKGGGQSSIGGSRKFRRRFSLGRYLSLGHLRRQWMKWTTVRIS